jgi:hypothetical protein
MSDFGPNETAVMQRHIIDKNPHASFHDKRHQEESNIPGRGIGEGRSSPVGRFYEDDRFTPGQRESNPRMPK